ncbi:MAG: TonB-dependent receptor [Opitutaceae bacterium]|jgi:outer membrane receptor for monomeric catechols|nr:TonB-dependent receptor [Opitutaceae bacterium]
MRLRVALCGLTAAASLVSFGQTTPAIENNTDDDLVILSPFEVRVDKDVGYTAASSLAGGRTDMPLKDTPAAISVMTREFIDDLAGTSFRELAEWSVNSIPEYNRNESPFGDYAIHLRGLGASYPSRNYFLWYVDGDGFNTERFEMARGPNGVLFGDGNIGGIATTWTKRARLDRPFVNVSARVDTYGGYRASLDVNQPVSKTFGLRLNALYDHVMSWRDRSDNDRTGLHLAGTWQISDKTALRFEGETGRRVTKVYPTNYGDHASLWDGVTTYDGITAIANPDAAGLQLIGSNRWVYIPAVPQAGYANWNTRYATKGTQLPLTPDGRSDFANFPRLPSREFNLQPPDATVSLDYYAATISLEHRFTNNLFVQIAYNRTNSDRRSHYSEVFFQNYQIDVNETIPTPNGTDIPNPKLGVPFSDAARQTQGQANTVDDARALLTYAVQTNWLDQRLSAIIGTRRDVFGMEQERLMQTGGTGYDPGNIIGGSANTFYERRYWDEPGKYNLGDIPFIPGRTFEYLRYYGNQQRKYTDYYQVASMSQFFDKRLTVQLGIRYDDYHQEQQVTGQPAGNRWPTVYGGNQYEPGKPAVFVPGSVTITDVSTTSKNAGAVYFLTEWLGVYANYAESFSTPGAGETLWDGRFPDISRSKGMDIGIKLELMRGKISGSINYYDTKQTDRLDFRPANNHQGDINTIWTELGKAERAVVFRDTQSYAGKGWEAEITANPNKNWTIMFNWALPETEADDIHPGLRAYYNQNIDEWQTGIAADPANLGWLQTNINNIKATLDGAKPGVTLNHTYKYTGNIYATYTIRDGVLKNLAFGAGANFRGKNKIGNTQASAFEYIYAESYMVASAHVSYKMPLGSKVSGRFQINVANLFDNDKIIHAGTSDYGGQRYLGAFRYIDPRRITLTATFDF